MGDSKTRHATMLGVLARSQADALKPFAEELLMQIDDVAVVENRTGLVMLPMADTVEGTSFHLGEVLMSEAHIQALGHVGYAMRQGRDLEAAMAAAVIDVAWQAGVELKRIDIFIEKQSSALAIADDDQMRAVEATRVNMETF